MFPSPQPHMTSLQNVWFNGTSIAITISRIIIWCVRPEHGCIHICNFLIIIHDLRKRRRVINEITRKNLTLWVPVCCNATRTVIYPSHRIKSAGTVCGVVIINSVVLLYRVGFSRCTQHNIHNRRWACYDTCSRDNNIIVVTI